MTKLQIILKLWGHITDLLLLAHGQIGSKTLPEIENELDAIEAACRPYADCDDDELAELLVRG